jgi:uncharacterized membrane protein YbhN (UPF0104 family)
VTGSPRAQRDAEPVRRRAGCACGLAIAARLARAVSLSQAQLPWQTSLAAFAVIRLLTAIPITQGGVGITELGLIGILATGAIRPASR